MTKKKIKEHKELDILNNIDVIEEYIDLDILIHKK